MNGESEKDLAPLGFCNFRNQRTKFGIKLDDRRRHIYTVGKTGVGKTTMLENMVISDINSGRGLAVIDPHGEFAERMLDFVPEKRIDDVIYFNPADMDYPIAFNPMEQVNPEFRHLVASGLMGVFKKIFVDVWSARMAYILNNTLLALLEFPGSTLLGIMRMLSEPAYRKKIVENLQDPVVKAFWVNEFARYTQRLETEAVAAIQNKVGQFISNPLIRNILGQPNSTLNMREIMDAGKIFIANLSKGKIGEDNSALLGAMVITRLQLAAMSRVDMSEDKRRDFFLYVDEFQNFATDSFANILSEARKYRLSLILAHQYIGQLMTDQSTKVRDAVFGNVGTIITFRVGGADAEFLETEFMPEFLQNDLVNLAKANVYIKLMIDGVASRPFSAETLPPQKTPLLIYKDIIVKNSQEKYGTPRKVVENKIASEWQSASETLLEEKIGRQHERPLQQTLRDSSLGRRPFSSYVSSSASSRQPEPGIVSLKRPRPINESATRSSLSSSVENVVKRSVPPESYITRSAVRQPQERPYPAHSEARPMVRPAYGSPRPQPAASHRGESEASEARPAARPAYSEARPMVRPPEMRSTHGNQPPIFQPKVHPKAEVNIDELRRAISESLSGKGSAEKSAADADENAATANRPVPPPIRSKEKTAADDDNNDDNDDSGKSNKAPLYGTDEDRDELNINLDAGEETLSLEDLVESEEKENRDSSDEI